MGASTQNMAVSMLILRIFAFMLLAASVVLLVTNNFTDSQGHKTSFKDIFTYRYVLAASVISLSYTLLQLPFAIYYACTAKRMIFTKFLHQFDFYSDKIICYILAATFGVGLAVSYELKRFINNFFNILVMAGLTLSDEDERIYDKFLDRGIVAIALLGSAFVFMVVVSVLSSIERNPPSKGFFGKCSSVFMDIVSHVGQMLGLDPSVTFEWNLPSLEIEREE